MNHSFEKMKPEHETGVMEIFNYYALNSFAAYPDMELPGQFFSRFLEIGMAYPAYVIKDADGGVIGFCLLRPYNPFPAFRETAEITCFIRKEYTGKGLGRSALAMLEHEAATKGIRRLLADISSENTGSIEFHRKNGFTRCGLFSNVGKKFGKSFSVVWMEKDIETRP